MAYQKIRERLPFQLSHKLASLSTSYEDVKNSYEVAVGGIPFNLKIDQNNPLIRSTAQFRKEQLDTSREPGEQSLSGWWLRSQSSFHYGAGVKYGDPELDPTAAFRFLESEGVNPWTPGEVSLLPSTVLVQPASGSVKLITTINEDGDESFWRATGSKVFRGWESFGEWEETEYFSGGIVRDIVTDGADIYVATNTEITLLPFTGGADVVKWNLTSATSVTMGWVKQRMVLGVNNSIYIPSFSSTTLPAAVYTHPNDSWVWSDIAEGPEAIYVSGGVGNESVILRLALDNTGAVPTLTAATVVANFPTGEIVTSMHSYLGTYLGIGTNRGFRVATFGSGGGLSYGPLIETPNPVYGITANESHFLFGYTEGFSDGMSGLMRVELRTQFDDGGFPYTTDLQAHQVGRVDAVALLPLTSRVVFGVADSGAYVQHSTDLEPTGFLTTGAQRFNTVWPKLFKKFNVRGTFNGNLIVSTIDQEGDEVSIVSLSAGSNQSQDLAINYPDTPQEFLSLKFTLSRNSTDNTIGAILRSYQLKALPGGPRPRQFTVPLLCFDQETDRHGNKLGYEGFAFDRLTAIEAMDSAGDAILFQDLTSDTAQFCTIEAMEYRQIDPRGIGNSKWGGVLTVALRTLSG